MSSNVANSGPLRFPHVKVGELIGGYTGSVGYDESRFDGCEMASVGCEVASIGLRFEDSKGHTLVGSHGGGGNTPIVVIEFSLVVDLLVHCPSLPGRQSTHVLLAFTQTQFLQ